jgi:hypothetical protein
MKYSFTLKDNNQKAYNLFTWFLFFLHVAAAMFALNTNDNKVKLSIYILLGFYALLSTVYYFYRKYPKALETFSLIMALFYANFWFQQVGIIAVLVFAAVYIIVTMVKGKRTTVLFTTDGVHLTRVFKTIIFPWSELENVILKDNILTIDFKTNKIIQVEIVETARMIDETEFNLFCKERLQTATAVENPVSG